MAGFCLALGHERVETTPRSEDFGADVVVDGGTDHAIAVQAKHWGSDVESRHSGGSGGTGPLWGSESHLRRSERVHLLPRQAGG
ncbi:MAG: restriction endonuclease [Candidatus Dormibacteria bacterium]